MRIQEELNKSDQEKLYVRIKYEELIMDMKRHNEILKKEEIEKIDR